MKTIHLIANSHLDPVWFWRWQEGMNEIIPTCRTVLDLMKEYPELKYTKGESLTYEHLQTHDPETFFRIKELVAEDRWELIGGWYNQPDTVLSDTESLFRQALYGQEYFEREFKKTSRIAYLVDSFGQAGGLPQIMKKTGFELFVFQRPRQNEMPLPSPLFKWQSNDGSEVVALRLIGGYTNETGKLKEKIELNLKEMPDFLDDWPVLFGLGDHGGGLSRKDLDLLLQIKEQIKADGIDLIFSTLEAFYKKVLPLAGNLPIFKGEMLYHGRGCLSANSKIKKQCWDLRKSLYDADFTSALSGIVNEGKSTNNSELEKSWKALLFNQFHDAICGTCSVESSEDSEKQLSGAVFSAEYENNNALLSLASQLDTRGEGQAVVAVNPHPWKVKAPLTVEFMLDYRPLEKNPETYSVVDSDGKNISYQEIPITSLMGNLQWRKKVLFMAELPPCGCGIFHIISGWKSTVSDSALNCGKESSDNGNISVSIDKDSGGIILKKSGEFSLQAGQLQVFEDYSDTWSHEVDKYDKYKGSFEFHKFEWIEKGPIRTVVRVTSKYNESVFIQDFEVIAGRRDVHCNAKLDWREKHAVAKLIFGTGKKIAKVNVFRVASWESSPLTGEELPNGILLNINDKDGKCFMISCPEKGAYSIMDKDIGITIARSSIYAWYRAELSEKAGYHEYLDIGKQKFAYTIMSSENMSGMNPVHIAHENGISPFILLTHKHDGKLGKKYSLFSTNKDGLILLSAANSIKENGTIFRFWNSRKETADYKITYYDMHEVLFSAKPEEIITLMREPDGKLKIMDKFEEKYL